MFIVHLLFMDRVHLNKMYFKGRSCYQQCSAHTWSGTCQCSWAAVQHPPEWSWIDCFEANIDFWVLACIGVDGVGKVLGRFPRGAGRSCTAQTICLMPSRVALFSRNTVSSAHVYELALALSVWQAPPWFWTRNVTEKSGRHMNPDSTI